MCKGVFKRITNETPEERCTRHQDNIMKKCEQDTTRKGHMILAINTLSNNAHLWTYLGYSSKTTPDTEWQRGWIQNLFWVIDTIYIWFSKIRNFHSNIAAEVLKCTTCSAAKFERYYCYKHGLILKYLCACCSPQCVHHSSYDIP